MSPHDIAMEDILSLLFDTVSGITNMRYFNAQKIAPLTMKEMNEPYVARFIMLCWTLMHGTPRLRSFTKYGFEKR